MPVTLPINAVTLPYDQIVTIALEFEDAVGIKRSAPVGATVVSSDPTIVTASLSADGNSVIIAAAAQSGATTVTYEDGTVTSELSITVIEPVVTSVIFEDGTATFAANPTPPTAAAPTA